MSPHWFCSTLCPPSLCRDFGTEFLTCDCRLHWLLPWARNRSLQLSERTLCAYPSALRAQALGGLQEAQLRCGEQILPLRPQAPSCRAPAGPKPPTPLAGLWGRGLGLQGILFHRSHWGLVPHRVSKLPLEPLLCFHFHLSKACLALPCTLISRDSGPCLPSWTKFQTQGPGPAT